MLIMVSATAMTWHWQVVLLDTRLLKFGAVIVAFWFAHNQLIMLIIVKYTRAHMDRTHHRVWHICQTIT